MDRVAFAPRHKSKTAEQKAKADYVWLIAKPNRMWGENTAGANGLPYEAQVFTRLVQSVSLLHVAGGVGV